MFWRSFARNSFGMITRSAIGLCMFLNRHHSLTALRSVQTLKARICSDARRHLKWYHHLPRSLTKTWSMSSNLLRMSVPEDPAFLDLFCRRIGDTHYCDVVSFLFFFFFIFIQEICQYITHVNYTNPVNLDDNPLTLWKQHEHLFLTLSRLARRYLSNPVTSCPVERLFSVAGQVDSSYRATLSSDNLTLLVFMHEVLPLLRKIRAHRIVEGLWVYCKHTLMLIISAGGWYTGN